MSDSRYVRVRAHADAKTEEVVPLETDLFEIFVKEPRERNEANKRIRELVARELNIPIGKVRLIAGHRHQSKIFEILQ